MLIEWHRSQQQGRENRPRHECTWALYCWVGINSTKSAMQFVGCQGCGDLRSTTVNRVTHDNYLRSMLDSHPGARDAIIWVWCDWSKSKLCWARNASSQVCVSKSKRRTGDQSRARVEQAQLMLQETILLWLQLVGQNVEHGLPQFGLLRLRAMHWELGSN